MMRSSRPLLHRRANRADSARQAKRLRERFQVERLESRAVLTTAFSDGVWVIDSSDHQEVAIATLETNHGMLEDVNTLAIPVAMPMMILGAPTSIPCLGTSPSAGNAPIQMPLDAPNDLQDALADAEANPLCYPYSSGNLPDGDSMTTMPGSQQGAEGNSNGLPIGSVPGVNHALFELYLLQTAVDRAVVTRPSNLALHPDVVVVSGVAPGSVDVRSPISTPLDLHRPLYETPPATSRSPMIVSTPSVTSAITSASFDMAPRPQRPEPSVAAIDRYFSAMRAVPVGTSSMRVDAQHDLFVARPLIHGGVAARDHDRFVVSDALLSQQVVAHRVHPVGLGTETMSVSDLPTQQIASPVRLPENPFRRVDVEPSTGVRRELRVSDPKASRRATASLPMSEELWKSMLALGAGICIYCQQSQTSRDDDEMTEDGSTTNTSR